LPDHDNNKKVKVKKNTLAQGRKKTNTTKIRARQQKRRTTLFRHLQTPDDAVNVDVSTLGKITVTCSTGYTLLNMGYCILYLVVAEPIII